MTSGCLPRGRELCGERRSGTKWCQGALGGKKEERADLRDQPVHPQLGVLPTMTPLLLWPTCPLDS